MSLWIEYYGLSLMERVLNFKSYGSSLSIELTDRVSNDPNVDPAGSSWRHKFESDNFFRRIFSNKIEICSKIELRLENDFVVVPTAVT